MIKNNFIPPYKKLKNIFFFSTKKNVADLKNILKVYRCWVSPTIFPLKPIKKGLPIELY